MRPRQGDGGRGSGEMDRKRQPSTPLASASTQPIAHTKCCDHALSAAAAAGSATLRLLCSGSTFGVWECMVCGQSFPIAVTATPAVAGSSPPVCGDVAANTSSRRRLADAAPPTTPNSAPQAHRPSTRDSMVLLPKPKPHISGVSSDENSNRSPPTSRPPRLTLGGPLTSGRATFRESAGQLSNQKKMRHPVGSSSSNSIDSGKAIKPVQTTAASSKSVASEPKPSTQPRAMGIRPPSAVLSRHFQKTAQSRPGSKQATSEKENAQDIAEIRSTLAEYHARLEAVRKRQSEKPLVPRTSLVIRASSAGALRLSKDDEWASSRSSGGNCSPMDAICSQRSLVLLRQSLANLNVNRAENPSPIGCGVQSNEKRGDAVATAAADSHAVAASPQRPKQPELPAMTHDDDDMGVLTNVIVSGSLEHAFGTVQATERVVRITYDAQHKLWAQTEGTVLIHAKPFAEGTLRYAFECMDVTDPSAPVRYVAKTYKERMKATLYYADAEMQAVAQQHAALYNAHSPPPPHPIAFIPVHLIKRIDRPGQPLMALEPYLQGEFVKYTNNFGYVNSTDERLTPQAFSHFSYEASHGELLICDIQGVGNRFTDPQIHTRSGKEYGVGNMGPKGFAKFFESHRCNALCQMLGLSPKPYPPVQVAEETETQLPTLSSPCEVPNIPIAKHDFQSHITCC